MRKIYLKILFLFFAVNLFPLTLPSELEGIWEGEDRYVFFEKNPHNDQIQMVVFLKEFYGWYIDRAAEPDYWKEAEVRPLNDATPVDPVNIVVDIKNISINQNDSAWELTLNYSKNNKITIPLCVVNNSMYLDFYTRQYDLEEKKSFENYDGLWHGVSVSSGLKVSPQSFAENISAYYIENNKYFDVRYWLSDMDFAEEKAEFKYKDSKFYVNKHIISCNRLYACTSGRSNFVRNPQPSFEFSENNFVSNKEKTLLVKNKIYLKRIADKNGMADLLEIAKKQNSKFAPLWPGAFFDDSLRDEWILLKHLEFYR